MWETTDWYKQINLVKLRWCWSVRFRCFSSGVVESCVFWMILDWLEDIFRSNVTYAASSCLPVGCSGLKYELHGLMWRSICPQHVPHCKFWNFTDIHADCSNVVMDYFRKFTHPLIPKDTIHRSWVRAKKEKEAKWLPLFMRTVTSEIGSMAHEYVRIIWCL